MLRLKKLIPAIAAALVIGTGTASAAVVTAGPGGFNNGYATSITYENNNTTANRGTVDNRANALNALGMPNGNFFEIGLGSSVILGFGKPFVSPVTVVEVTFGKVDKWLETASLEGRKSDGTFALIGTITNLAAQTPGAVLTFLGGPFDALRITDTSSAQGNATTGGFDIDSVRVAPIPLPAGFLLLVSALAGLGLIRSRRSV